MKKIICCQSGSKAKADLEKAGEFLKIISEPNRLKLLCCLRNGEKCVCEIRKNLDLPQNLTSHHLKTLKNFGLTDSRQEGRKIIYSTNKEAISKHILFLNNFLIKICETN